MYIVIGAILVILATIKYLLIKPKQTKPKLECDWNGIGCTNDGIERGDNNILCDVCHEWLNSFSNNNDQCELCLCKLGHQATTLWRDGVFGADHIVHFTCSKDKQLTSALNDELITADFTIA